MLLKKIPNSVQILLCASAQINNYRKVIEELVYNALDADSTSIAVRIHTQEYSLQIIDNGHGISKCDFDVLGQRHMTSKCVDLATLKSAPNKYGVRGESLSNIIEVSQSIRIISRLQNTDETWTKTFFNGKQQNTKKSAIRPSKGTTVEIKGFLHNLRIKKNTLDPLYELQQIKAFMEQVSLIHSNISLSLRDDLKNEIIFQLHKKRDIYQTLSTLFNIEKSDVQELKVEKNQYKVTAYIGKMDKEVGKHWIFLNGKFVHNSKLHKIINDTMNNKNKKGRVTKLKSKNQNDNEENHLINKQIPFYFILITCPQIDYDISKTPKQNLLEFRNWEQVTKLLEKLVNLYTGDTKLKEIITIENPKKGIEDKKTQVKNIIDKFLASNSKKLRVSQMHNGVKGKLIKRERKKPLKIPLTTIQQSKKSKNYKQSYGMISAIVTKLHPNKYTIDNQLFDEIIKQKKDNINEHETSLEIQHPQRGTKSKDANKNRCKSNQNNIKPPPGRHVPKIHNKIISTKKSQLKLKNKPKAYNEIRKSRLIKDPIISRFANPTNSIKKRCTMIAEKANEVLNKKMKRKQEVYINEKVEYSHINKDNKNISIRKKIDEIIIHDYIPIPSQINIHNNKCDFKSTYDLVNTILKSQQENICEHSTTFSEMNMKSVNSHDRTKFVLPKTFKYTSPEIPSLTFDSHNNDIYEIDKIKNISFGNNKKWSLNAKFMTNRSRENFIAPNNRCSPKYLGKNNLNIRNNKQFTEMIKKTANSTLLYNINKQYAEETSYTIDFTKNDKSPVCYDNLKGNNGILTPYNICRYDEINCTHSGSRHEIVNISDCSPNKIIGNTYTIVNDDHANFRTSMDTENPLLPRGTYPEHNSYDQYSNSQLRSNVISMEQEIYSQQRDSFDDILALRLQAFEAEKVTDNETEPIQGSKAEILIEKELDPLNVCQAVLNSYDIFKDEFEFSFNASNNLNDSLFNINIINDIESEIVNKYEQNGDIKELQENLSHHFNNMLDKTNTAIALEQNLEMHNMIVKSNQISGYVQDNLNNQLPDIESNQNIKATELRNFDLKNRLRFMPKGMSPLFENCNSKTACNYNLDKDYYEDNLYINFVNDVQMNSEVFEQKIQAVKDVTTGHIDKVYNRLKKDDASLKFNGLSLKTARVLGQVDDKFIAAIIKGKLYKTDEISEFLVLFDQHAVHERIRLEEILSEYITNDQWKSVALDNVSIKMPKDVVLYLHNYKAKFSQLGLQWIIQNDGDITITAIPEAILGKNPREVEKVIKSVKNLIAEEISIIKLQRGCVSLYPRAIMDLVFSEACRYAIKFGDKLTRNTCVELLNTLSKCKTPFQCAHGRPVMAVLINIKSCAREYEVNIKKIYDFKQKVDRLRCN